MNTDIFRFTGPLGDWLTLLRHGNEGDEPSKWMLFKVWVPIGLGAVAVALFNPYWAFGGIVVASWLFAFVKWSEDKRAFEEELTLDQMFAPRLVDFLSFIASMAFVGGLLAFVGKTL